MKIFSERRLLHRRASDFDDQTRYSPRVAEANAQLQQEAHQQQLTSLQQSGQSVNQAPAPVASDVRQQQLQAQPGSILNQAAQAGNPISYNTTSGQVTQLNTDPRNPSGYVAPGAKVGDERNMFPTGNSATSMTERSAARGQQRSKADEVESKIRSQYAGLGIADPALIEKAVSEARAAALNEDAAELSRQTAEKEKMNAGINQRQETEQTTPTSATGAGAAAAFANLPPEAQFLAPFLQQYQQSIDQSLQENAQMTAGMLEGVNKSFGSVDSQLAEMREGYKASTDAMQGLLEDAKEQTDRALAEQVKAEKDRLAWEEYSVRTKVERQKRDQHDALVAQFALAGGFGQPAAMAEVMSSDAEFDSKLQDLAVQFSFARTDLAAKFSGLYAENQNNYVTQTVSNMKELRSSLERIGMQSISNAQARQSAEQSILSKAFDRQASLRDQLAKQNLDTAGQMVSLMHRDQQLKLEEKRYEEQRDWDKYKFEVDQNLRMMEMGASQQAKEEAAAEKEDQQSFDRFLRTQQQISGRIAQDKIVQGAETVQVRYDNIRSAERYAQQQYQLYKDGKIDKKSMNFVDQALINSFNKMVDPESVVREAEYARTPEGMAVFEKWEAKARNIVDGGILTPDEREELTRVSEKLWGSWEETLNQRRERFYLQVDAYNQRAPEDYQLQYDEFGLPSDYTTSTQRESLDDLLPAGYVPSGNPFQPQGGEESPASSYLGYGKVTQGFATPIASRTQGGLYDESTVKAWGGTHKGLDIAMKQGTDLPAPVSGTVVYAGQDGGWGGTVIIRDESGAEHRLSHLSTVGLQEGAKISKGQIVGKSGGKPGTSGAGNSTGAHLDYRIRVGGKYVDPLSYAT